MHCFNFLKYFGDFLKLSNSSISICLIVELLNYMLFQTFKYRLLSK